MKIKTRIIGIGLALMLIASVVAMAVPASAGPPGDTIWLEQSKPGIPAYPIYNGSDGTDFVQGSDGRVWIIDGIKDVMKTGTSGTVWSSVGNYASAGALKPSNIGVAPDNSDVVAVSENGSLTIQISNDRGVTWSNLPALTAGNITDVAVGPARSGLLLGREYAVAIADDSNATTVGGVYIIGATATWTNVAATVGTADFMRIEFSPGYIGDRVLAAVGVTAAGTVTYSLLNTSTNAVVSASYPATVVATGLADPGDGTVNEVRLLDLALPSDFDPTTSPVAYVSVGCNPGTPTASSDVYRMNGGTARALGAVTTQAVDSVGYAGTQSEGTLFVGYTLTTGVDNAARVKRTANPTSNTPTWTATRTNPTGSNFTNVKPNYDFASSNRVNVFSRGNESAWSISEDGGVSFYGRSWVDNGVTNDWVDIEDMAVPSDESGIWFLTDDGADIALWSSPLPPSSMSQKRMYFVDGSGDGAATASEIQLNPDWAASPSIYILDRNAAPDRFLVSHNGGTTWLTRTAPAATVNTWAVVDQNTIYATNSNSFFKSTNAGWTWEAAVAWNTSGTANCMVVTDDGTIFLSDTSVRKSSNGGASWSSVGSYGNSGNDIIVLPDENYADNGIVYQADNVTGLVQRLDVSTNTYRDLGYTVPVAGTAEQPLLLTQVGGVLYLVNAQEAARNTAPTASLAAASASWNRLDNGAALWAHTADKAVMVGNTLYVNGNSAAYNLANHEDIWGYIDSTAATKPMISAPSSGAIVNIDPVSGRGVPITLSVDALGDAQGAVNQWTWRIYDKAAGVSTATSSAGWTASSVQTSSMVAPFTAMLPNTTYVVQVRGTRTASGEVLNTPWSDSVEITVASGSQVTQTYAGPQILGPQGGGTTGLNPGFAWAPVSGATKYQFIVATDASLTKTIGGTPVEVTTPSYQVTGLDYGTTYFWAVKVMEPTPGTQTISTFTTMEKPAAPSDGGGTAPPPVNVEVPTQPIPDVIVNVPPATDGGGGAISDTAIWAVIGIGAVLIVAVLVLIVRTRRPV